jgi:hypothetical protein
VSGSSSGWWKETDLLKTETNPMTRMNGIAIESRSSWSHVKFPGIMVSTQGKVRKISATIKISRQINEEDKARHLELGR